MYDPVSLDVFGQAISVDGIDPGDLPDLLTKAYSELMFARIRLADAGDPAHHQDTELSELLATVRRIARTYEAITLSLDAGHEKSASCSFVAGSAYSILVHAQKSGYPIAQAGSAQLSDDHVGFVVAATLLFLTGGFFAEAADISHTISGGVTPSIRRVLSGLAAISSGNGQRISAFLEEEHERESTEIDADYLDVARLRIWTTINGVIEQLAQRLMGFDAEDPQRSCDQLLSAITSFRGEIDAGFVRLDYWLPLPGHVHLLELLSRTVASLLARSALNTEPPIDTEAQPWRQFLKEIVKQRPFLWRNHLEAIASGFLNPGTSWVVTFPTGAGKTKLTELRIAGEYIRSRSTIYLAPTRALVAQVRDDLSKVVRLPPQGARNFAAIFEEFGEQAGPKILVQTPEQCLAMLLHAPKALEDIGLIVVDECHQIGCKYTSSECPDRRAFDAMWALLRLSAIHTSADLVLISAMVSNGKELSDWLKEITNRPALPLTVQWKPTRQVRGFLAYSNTDSAELTQKLTAAQRASGRRKPRAAEKRGYAAVPLGVFCHKQVWSHDARYSVAPLLGHEVDLSVSDTWRLTANRNEVAGSVLAAMVKSGIRPLVFTQNVLYTHSIANSAESRLEKYGTTEAIFTEMEEDLFAAAAIELGAIEHVERPTGGRIGTHHGRLINSERLAIESAFRRPDGLLALVATPTVAQGINLPAEAVILAGDDRWDQVTNKPEALLVHEVLNAAGRAGRAGSHSHGFVINIPANGPYVIEGCNFDSMPEDQQDQCLGLFGRPDQCFEVYDPIERALDYVATLDELDDDAEYFVRRMSALSDDQLSGVISRTLGKFKSEHPPAVEDQVQFIQELSATTDTDTELARIAGEIGIPAHTVREIVETCGAIDLDQSFSDLQESLWTWLISSQEVLQSLDPGILTAIKRILPVDDLNGEDVANWTIRWVDALLQTLPAWTSGSPLVDVGAFLFDRRGNKRAKTSAIALGRLFSLGVNSNIAYCISLVCACIQRHRTDLSPRQLAILAVLPGATREGFNIPDQLLTYNALLRHRGLYPRVKVHQIFSMVAERLSPWEPGVDLDSRAAEVRRIANAAI